MSVARQLARSVRDTLKGKDLFWLPTLDAFRTFASECPVGMLPGFLASVAGQKGARV